MFYLFSPKGNFSLIKRFYCFLQKEIRSPTILQMVKIKIDWKEIKNFFLSRSPTISQTVKIQKNKFRSTWTIKKICTHCLSIIKIDNEINRFWTLVSWPENITNTLCDKPLTIRGKGSKTRPSVFGHFERSETSEQDEDLTVDSDWHHAKNI